MSFQALPATLPGRRSTMMDANVLVLLTILLVALAAVR
jgi:hypothetical protein